jgi:signal transduction histidine kinase
MSSDKPFFTRTFGLRIALWYATLFVVGSVAVLFLTYRLTASSLVQRDRQIINAKLGQYVTVYSRAGIVGLADVIRAEQRTAPERLFVRVVAQGTETIVLAMPEGWDSSRLESATTQLRDGTVMEVAKSTDAREDLLTRFRAVLGLAMLSIVAVALTGGFMVTRTAVQPIRHLIDVVAGVIRTGRTDERVPLAGGGDAIEELTHLFNTMLARIEGVVAAMRGALDTVSHDLRTPLTRLRGSAEMALAAPPDLDRYREALADCVEETDRVLVMLDTLMDISEAQSGALELRREPVRLADVAARAVDLYRDVAEARNVTLVADLAPAPVVTGDRTRLEQVAANLIDNAVKYTPSGGRVDVEVAQEGTTAVLRVRDTGAGIAADDLPRIWDRLFRGDAARSERGLGLGLSLVKAIVEAHRGTVTVASEPGTGSTFEVRIEAV